MTNKTKTPVISARARLWALDLTALAVVLFVAQRPDGVAIACTALIVVPIVVACYKMLSKPERPPSLRPSVSPARSAATRKVEPIAENKRDAKNWLRENS